MFKLLSENIKHKKETQNNYVSLSRKNVRKLERPEIVVGDDALF